MPKLEAILKDKAMLPVEGAEFLTIIGSIELDSDILRFRLYPHPEQPTTYFNIKRSDVSEKDLPELTAEEKTHLGYPVNVRIFRVPLKYDAQVQRVQITAGRIGDIRQEYSCYMIGTCGDGTHFNVGGKGSLDYARAQAYSHALDPEQVCGGMPFALFREPVPEERCISSECGKLRKPSFSRRFWRFPRGTRLFWD